MKTLLLTLSLTLFFSSSFSQVPDAEHWEVLPGAPKGGYWNHDDIDFITPCIGWVCDLSGTISKTIDGGESWTELIDMPGTSFRAMAWLTEQHGFVGTLGPGSWVTPTSDTTKMYETIDGGVSWTPVNTIPKNPDISGICGLQAIDETHIVGVGRYDGPAVIVSSDDAGATWTSYDTDDLAESLVDVHFFNPDTGVACGRKSWQSIILRTTDGGKNWTRVLKTAGDHFWKMYFVDEQNGYAQMSNYSYGARRYYFKTENAGKNWTKVEYSDPTDDYEGLGIGFWSRDTGWASGGTNTWQTYDGGDTWKEVEIDPSNKGDVINRFLRVGDVMYAAGVKIYKFNPNNVEDVNCTIGIKERPEIVEDNCTITCSPNPFAGSGQITYFVPEDGHVSIGITSIGGRLLELLVDEKQKAGTYTIAYNPKYNAKFVGCTILTGPYRANVKIIRPGGGNFATDY